MRDDPVLESPKVVFYDQALRNPPARRGRETTERPRAPVAATTRVDVCICTYRRPAELEIALTSVADQQLPDSVRLRVVVIDNDDGPSAAVAVARVARATGLEIDYRHVPAHNISLARNAALEAAEGEWLALMDDDGIAPPEWLGRLLEAARAHGADVVFGPCAAVYPAGTPDWVRRGDFHSTRLPQRHGPVVTGHTGNALVRRALPALATTRFDLARGRTGGEDTDFFHRLHRAGARMAYARGAVIHDVISPDRVNLAWLVARWFRSGQSHASLYPAGPVTPEGFVRCLVSLTKMLFCALCVLFNAGSPIRRTAWMLRGALHAGAFCWRLGVAEPEVY